MRNTDFHHSMAAGEQERRDEEAPGNRLLGRVVACSGSRATISAVAEAGETALTELWSVGRLISISVGDNRVVALVYAMGTMLSIAAVAILFAYYALTRRAQRSLSAGRDA